MSAGTWILRPPPVTLERIKAPFLPRYSMASKTIGAKPVASNMRSKGPYLAAASFSDVTAGEMYRTPISSRRSEFRYGAGRRPELDTSRPRIRWGLAAIIPFVLAPLQVRHLEP